MSGDVTPCLKCGAMNWAGKEKCDVCGGELAPTLSEVYAYMYATDADFKKQVDEQRKQDGE